jgi:hypothetical protein
MNQAIHIFGLVSSAKKALDIYSYVGPNNWAAHRKQLTGLSDSLKRGHDAVETLLARDGEVEDGAKFDLVTKEDVLADQEKDTTADGAKCGCGVGERGHSH